MKVIEEVKEIKEDIIKWRRELHKTPEIAFQLYKTSDFVRQKLLEMGIEHKIIAENGIIATIYGTAIGIGESSGKVKTIGLRADMDGLPIKEETGLEFTSENNCMHACGHDAHLAMLLGAAKVLSENKDKLSGNVRFIFQPAEENVGGAEIMIEQGCFENPSVDAIIGLHIGCLSNEISCGQIGVKAGAMMAAVDDFRIKIKGKGGHGAAPHECIDPVVITSEIICSLQKIVSREVSPVNPAVLTIGKIQGGTAFNIIPDSVEIEGCVRTLTDNDRSNIEKRIKEIVEFTTKANRGSCEIEYMNKYPVLVNDKTITSLLSNAAVKIVGSESVIDIKNPIMASEDMSYYLKKIPGTFFYLGSNNQQKGIVYPHHHPKFNVDEDTLWIGSAVFVQSVLDYLGVKN
jgi:amidohydrolase